ncbi:hypothetical protein [Streptomyces sp. NPDC007083]|uniref:hypothetical protein n=1 Tax=Streptomyces sp. NPDC007083 TaxID=3156913 RepID=UPI0034092EEF
MAIVSTCTYDAQGRLIRPSTSDIRSARFGADLDTGGESLTLDRGSVHFHCLTATGLTTDQARTRVNAKLARFFERVKATPGYHKIEMNQTQDVIPCNHNITITYEILYAIQAPSREHSHSASPEPLYARYSRGRSAVRR